MARPTTKTPALVEEIVLRTAEGESLRAICGSTHMPSRSTVHKWLVEDRVFLDQYAIARELRADVMFDETIAIADDASNDWVDGDKGPVFDHEHVQRSRLRIDARKWALARMVPKKYGDKVTNVVEGGDKPLQTLELGADGKPANFNARHTARLLFAIMNDAVAQPEDESDEPAQGA